MHNRPAPAMAFSAGPGSRRKICNNHQTRIIQNGIQDRVLRLGMSCARLCSKRSQLALQSLHVSMTKMLLPVVRIPTGLQSACSSRSRHKARLSCSGTPKCRRSAFCTVKIDRPALCCRHAPDSRPGWPPWWFFLLPLLASTHKLMA